MKFDGYVAFDIEIAKELQEGDDWTGQMPLGISCAATLTDDGDLRIWYGRQRYSNDRDNDGLPIADKMNEAHCWSLLIYLCQQLEAGKVPLTWNGLGFDFRVLADESRLHLTANELALAHIDIAFAMFCDLGYMIGLDTAAKGIGLPGKPEGMDGAKAPVMWKQGREAQEAVLQYVAQDVRMTAAIYEAILERGCLPWTSSRGNPMRWPARKPKDGSNRLLTVREALALPLPDTSWMTNPWPRSKFAGWLQGREEVLDRAEEKSANGN